MTADTFRAMGFSDAVAYAGALPLLAVLDTMTQGRPDTDEIFVWTGNDYDIYCTVYDAGLRPLSVKLCSTGTVLTPAHATRAAIL